MDFNNSVKDFLATWGHKKCVNTTLSLFCLLKGYFTTKLFSQATYFSCLLAVCWDTVSKHQNYLKMFIQNSQQLCVVHKSLLSCHRLNTSKTERQDSSFKLENFSWTSFAGHVREPWTGYVGFRSFWAEISVLEVLRLWHDEEVLDQTTRSCREFFGGHF